MSKVDAQRAMREARYAAYEKAATARAAAASSAPPPPASTPSGSGKAPAAKRARAAKAASGSSTAPAEEDLLSESAAPEPGVLADGTPGEGTVADQAVAVADAPAAAGQETVGQDADGDADGEAGVEEQLCGHRNMGNKLCRRPAGHPEKNHRYT